MSMPFCLMSFAKAPMRMEVLEALTASAKRALGFCSSMVFSAAARFSRSSLSCVAREIIVSGSVRISSTLVGVR